MKKMILAFFVTAVSMNALAVTIDRSSRCEGAAIEAAHAIQTLNAKQVDREAVNSLLVSSSTVDASGNAKVSLINLKGGSWTVKLLERETNGKVFCYVTNLN